MTAHTYTIFGRRGGIILLADGRTPARNITAGQVTEYLSSSLHIGTNLDRFVVIDTATDEEFTGSEFAYVIGG